MKRTWLVTLSTPVAMMACGNLSTSEQNDHASPKEERNLESFQQAVDNDDARTMYERAVEAANAFGETSADKLQAAKDKAKEAWDNTKGTLSDAYTNSYNAAKSVFEDSQDKSQSAAEKAADKAGDIKDATKDKAKDARDAASDAKDKAADKVHSRGFEAQNTAVERAYLASHNAAEDVVDFAGETADRVANDIADAQEAMQEAEEDRAEQILHEGDAAYDDAHNRGETALDRSADAVGDAAEDAADAASTYSERAKRRVNNAGEYIKHSAKRTHDNIANHEETFRQKNIDTFNKGIDTVKQGWDTAKYGTRAVTVPAYKSGRYTADRFKDSASWANAVRKDAVAWERSRRTWLEKKVVRGSATVSGYIAGIFSGGVEGAKEKSRQAAAATEDITADALRKTSDKLDRAAKKTDRAADKVEAGDDYASIGLKDVPDARMGFALGVELFADRICDGLRDKRQLNADETADCLAKQRSLYTWYYGKSLCRENGFKTDLLSECLALAPETAGGRKGESGGYTAPLNKASRDFYWKCGDAKLCAP